MLVTVGFAQSGVVTLKAPLKVAAQVCCSSMSCMCTAKSQICYPVQARMRLTQRHNAGIFRLPGFLDGKVPGKLVLVDFQPNPNLDNRPLAAIAIPVCPDGTQTVGHVL